MSDSVQPQRRQLTRIPGTLQTFSSNSVALFHQILVFVLSLPDPSYATTHVRSSHVALQFPEAVCLSFLFDIFSLCSSDWVISVDLQIY